MTTVQLFDDLGDPEWVAQFPLLPTQYPQKGRFFFSTPWVGESLSSTLWLIQKTFLKGLTSIFAYLFSNKALRNNKKKSKAFLAIKDTNLILRGLQKSRFDVLLYLHHKRKWKKISINQKSSFLFTYEVA